MKFLKEEGFNPSHKIFLFDKKQIVALTFSFGASIVVLIIMFFFREQVNLTIFRGLATFDLILLLFRLTNYKFLQKTFTLSASLPLHLCNFNLVLCFVAAWSQNIYLYDFLFSLSPFAALAALLFPDIEAARYPHFNFRSLEYYISHTLLILMPIMPVLYLGFRPSLSYASQSGVIFLSMLMVAGIAVHLTDGNYVFLNEAPDKTPLKAIENRYGVKIYRMSLIASFVFIYLLMHFIAYLIFG